ASLCSPIRLAPKPRWPLVLTRHQGWHQWATQVLDGCGGCFLQILNLRMTMPHRPEYKYSPNRVRPNLEVPPPPGPGLLKMALLLPLPLRSLTARLTFSSTRQIRHDN